MDSASTHGVPTDSTSTDSLPGSVPLYQFGGFRTVHPPLVQQLKQLETIAQSTSNVLLLGESGTGKELLAHAVHHKSSRRGHPFIPINCAAIPAELLESELFGYEPGAFTDARHTKQGKLALAHGGTLFLDEIADLPLLLQPKLLRVLETHQVEPLGGVQSVPADFRLISATNQNLEERIQQGLFREDLYYRLWGERVQIPPLRSRSEDIGVLAEHFLQQECSQCHKPLLKFSTAVWCCLFAHGWPGNGRELERVIHRCVVVCQGEVIERGDLPETHRGEREPPPSLNAMLTSVHDVLERQKLLDALEQHRWNRQQTARALGIDRKTLYRKLKRYAIQSLILF